MFRKISTIYKILTTVSLFAGVLISLIKTSSTISLISYYTLQSNIICFVSFLSFSIIEIRNRNNEYEKNEVYYLFKGAITIMIFITMFYYYIALIPFGFDMELANGPKWNKEIGNLLVHTFSPSLVILDYFLFDKKGKFKFYYPFLWLFFPLNYVMYVYFYASHGGTFYKIGGSERFAYFFLDYIKLGVYGVVKWLIVMTLVILVISFILVMIDRKLEKREKS